MIFCKIVLHLNSIDSRYIFDTCCVHLIISVALLCKDIAVIVAVPLFQWENAYTKITTPLHTLGHKTRMANDIAILFSDLAFLIIFSNTENVKYSKNAIIKNGPKSLLLLYYSYFIWHLHRPSSGRITRGSKNAQIP